MRAGGRMGDAKVFENGDRDSGRPMVFFGRGEGLGGKGMSGKLWPA
ncbi:hypothetical protein V491_02969, partial [Pseudogymnoascus sp. VKM F-3775]